MITGLSAQNFKVISSMSASDSGCPARRPALIAFRILDSTDRCLSFRNWCIPALLWSTNKHPVRLCVR